MSDVSPTLLGSLALPRVRECVRFSRVFTPRCVPSWLRPASLGLACLRIFARLRRLSYDRSSRNLDNQDLVL